MTIFKHSNNLLYSECTERAFKQRLLRNSAFIGSMPYYSIRSVTINCGYPSIDGRIDYKLVFINSMAANAVEIDRNV